MVRLESLKKSNQFKKVLREKKVHSEYFSIFAAKNKFPIGEVAINIGEREDAPRFGTNFTGDYKIIRAMLLSLC